MKENTPPKTKNALVLLLICLLILLSAFSYKKTTDYNKLEGVFTNEKLALQSELDELIEDYKSLSIKKKDLSKRLVKEINRIIALKDSVKNLKATQFKLISRYRKKVETLERQNKRLFFKVDSLSIANKTLKEENSDFSDALVQKTEETRELKKAQKKLEESQKKLQAKVAIAGIIKTGKVNAIAMKERSSGKLTSTSRSSRADAFKVNFKLLKNDVATKGEKTIYLQVVDQNKNIIALKGTTILKNGEKIGYSHELTADYQQENVNILSLILVNRDDVNKGIYTISVFVDGNYSGATTVKLR